MTTENNIIKKALDEITSKLDQHTINFDEYKVQQEKTHEDIKNEYMELKLALNKQNENIQPIIDTFGNLRWGEKVLIRVGIFLGGLVTFVIGVVEIIRLITHLNK